MDAFGGHLGQLGWGVDFLWSTILFAQVFSTSRWMNKSFICWLTVCTGAATGGATTGATGGGVTAATAGVATGAAIIVGCPQGILCCSLWLYMVG